MENKETIMWALKNTNVRITIGNNRWMYWDETNEEWVVMEQGYRKKKPIVLSRDKSEEISIKILCQ